MARRGPKPKRPAKPRGRPRGQATVAHKTSRFELVWAEVFFFHGWSKRKSAHVATLICSGEMPLCAGRDEISKLLASEQIQVRGGKSVDPSERWRSLFREAKDLDPDFADWAIQSCRALDYLLRFKEARDPRMGLALIDLAWLGWRDPNSGLAAAYDSPVGRAAIALQTEADIGLIPKLSDDRD